MKASRHGHVEVVQTLIARQALLDLKSHVSQLPVEDGFSVACMRTHVYFEPVSCMYATYTFNLQKGQTALMYSIRGQHENVSEKLIVAGSDISIRDKVSDYTVN